MNYFWNCLLCFSKHTKGSVTSFSILFNFQGPVAPSAFRLTAYLLYHRSDFCQALIFEVLRFSELVSCNLLSASARNLTSSYWFFRFTSQQRLRSHSLSPRLVLEYNTTHLPPCQLFFPFFFKLFLNLLRRRKNSRSSCRKACCLYNRYILYYCCS